MQIGENGLVYRLFQMPFLHYFCSKRYPAMFLLLCVLAASVCIGTSREETCDEGFRCRDGEKCIPKWYLCDGDNDCSDQSDELNVTCAESCTGPTAMWCEASGRCHSSEDSCLAVSHLANVCEDAGFAEACSRYCKETPGLVSCRNESTCVRESWLCDGDMDCGNGSDEDATTCNRLCSEKTDHVLCKNHQCLHKEEYCFRHTGCVADVPAGSCEDICRDNDFFHCNASSGSAGRKCVHSRYVCDGDIDCPEGEDESDSECEAKCAARGNFMCEREEGRSTCINANWVCDGNEDCPKGDDETSEDCSSICNNRPDHIFFKEESRCLTVREACNRGYSNDTVCDEYCNQNGFDYKCKSGEGPSCIKKAWLCDGKPDCPHGEDEDRSMCEQLCNTTGSTYCEAEKRCRRLPDLCKPRKVVETECDTAPCEAFCQSHGFSCPGNTTACMPGDWRCDGDMDCPGGEDETECGGVAELEG